MDWAIPFLILGVLTCAAHLWGVIRVARSNGLHAAIMFFVPVSAIRYLFRYWGDEKSDIRVQLALTGVFYGLFVYAMKQTETWVVKDAQAQAAQAKYALALLQAGERDDVDRKIAIGKAQAGVTFVGGKIKLDEAHAELDLPEHFRFARAAAVKPIADAMGRGVLPGTLGWVLHDQVALTDDDAWIIEVHWYSIGFIAEGPPDSLGADQLVKAYIEHNGEKGGSAAGDWEWKGFVYRPEWNATHGVLSWSEKTFYPDSNETLVDNYADLPARRGVLAYELEYERETRAEIAYRSVRLIALRTRFEDGWTAADYSRLLDRKKGTNLSDLITGKAFENLL